MQLRNIGNIKGNNGSVDLEVYKITVSPGLMK